MQVTPINIGQPWGHLGRDAQLSSISTLPFLQKDVSGSGHYLVSCTLKERAVPLPPWRAPHQPICEDTTTRRQGSLTQGSCHGHWVGALVRRSFGVSVGVTRPVFCLTKCPYSRCGADTVPMKTQSEVGLRLPGAKSTQPLSPDLPAYKIKSKHVFHKQRYTKPYFP